MVTETSHKDFRPRVNHLKCVRNLQLWDASGMKLILVEAQPTKRRA